MACWDAVRGYIAPLARLSLGIGAILLAGVPTAMDASGNGGNGAVVSLQSLRRSYGFQSLSIRGKTAVLSTRFHSLDLEKDSRRAVCDGIVVWLNGPVEKSWGRWLMLQADVNTTVFPWLRPMNAVAAEGYATVVLDAGHGGEDRGASIPRRGVDEKQLTLELARNVRDILKRYQVDVRLTRADDRTVTLDDRYRLAGMWNADVFVSMHFNAAASARPSGVETHILPPAGYPVTADPSAVACDRMVYPGNRHDGANMVLGYTLHKSLLKYTHGEDRGVRRSRFAVMRNASCPAALVECGFLTHPGDQKKILAVSYRRDIARGIAEGILAYLNTVKRAHHLNP